MKKIYIFLCSHFRFFEVWIRLFYYRFLKERISPSNIRGNYLAEIKRIDKKVFKDFVSTLGINKGDILIVHSSMDGLSSLDMNAKEIIDWLLELVGEEGTLCMPAFPLFRESDYSKDLISGESIITYDVKRTPCWTGMLPNLFLRYAGVIRSNFPNNPLAAKGKCSEDMMKDNLLADKPHGHHSAWEYCVDHHAKILYLGCPLSHSLTMLHVREDLDDDWPINNWYLQQKYKIVQPDGLIQQKTIYERKLFWARYFTEGFSARELVKSNIAREYLIGSISVGFIQDSYELFQYLFKQKLSDSIIFKIPSKYIKNGEKNDHQ